MAEKKKPEKKEAERKPKPKAKPKKKPKPKPEKKAEKAKPKRKPVEKKPKTRAEPEKKPEEKKPEEEKPKKKPPEKKPKRVEKIKLHKTRELSDEEKEQIKGKPRFFRQELHLRKKLDDKWRRPRGIDSKKHEGKRGKGRVPSIGYKKPITVSGLDYGHRASLVKNTKELDNLSPNDAIIISRTVGRKKRNDIIKCANEKKIIVLNPRKGEL